MRKKLNHGGPRQGAGRKTGSGKYGEPTRSMRIPVSYEPAIQKVLDQAAATRGITKSAELKLFTPIENPPTLPRPLFSSSVPAGFPSPADDYVEGQLDLNEYMTEHPSATFYVRVTGESMQNAGIFSGDILVVDRSLEPVHGKVVIAIVNNELTVKRLYCKNGKVELHPENPDFPIVSFSNDMELVIWGVVAGVVRKF